MHDCIHQQPHKPWHSLKCCRKSRLGLSTMSATTIKLGRYKVHPNGCIIAPPSIIPCIQSFYINLFSVRSESGKHLRKDPFDLYDSMRETFSSAGKHKLKPALFTFLPQLLTPFNNIWSRKILKIKLCPSTSQSIPGWIDLFLCQSFELCLLTYSVALWKSAVWKW